MAKAHWMLLAILNAGWAVAEPTTQPVSPPVAVSPNLVVLVYSDNSLMCHNIVIRDQDYTTFVREIVGHRRVILKAAAELSNNSLSQMLAVRDRLKQAGASDVVLEAAISE